MVLRIIKYFTSELAHLCIVMDFFFVFIITSAHLENIHYAISLKTFLNEVYAWKTFSL